VPTESCDASVLARVDKRRLEEAFSAHTLHGEWADVAQEMTSFQISTSAGGVNPGDRRALYYLVRSFDPTHVLEIGTHVGASTVHIAAALRTNGGKGQLTSVDILDVNDVIDHAWQRHGSLLAPTEMIDRMGMAGSVRFVAQPSLEFLAQTGPKYDFVFLDGDHAAATVYRELPATLRRLRPGGLVLLHDYFPQGRALWSGDPVISGPWLAVERLRREGAMLRVLPLGALPWPTKLGGSMTSLAAVVQAA
jgi:predicted O-methyltransferase YrrM